MKAVALALVARPVASELPFFAAAAWLLFVMLSH